MADLELQLHAAGFEAVSLVPKPESREYIKNWLPGSGCEDFVVSADVTARKPLSAIGNSGGGCSSSSGCKPGAKGCC